MKVLIAGATGATGRLLTEQLLNEGHLVTVIVRSTSRLPQGVQTDKNLTVVEASLLDLSDAELAKHVAGCDAVASCLGHNLTFKGVYGHPRRLVTDAMRRLAGAVRANRPEKKTKFVLMNTTGNRNGNRDEPISLAQKAVIGLLRLLLPPHVDNEQAADFLRVEIGMGDKDIEWAAVGREGLIEEEGVTAYSVHPSPVVSAILGGGKTSRINVAHFMAALITDEACWQQWKGEMPVIYNEGTV